ncbi:glycosyltransferase family 1 protein [Dyadobacter psychrophilus]|uniref:Glycosyltransferase involved in cell wall bisynthesis n=1 Tax=Dyadobacter psychrophilus TaxID=651661 RepID=A0A1T5HC56_9BACT|nr:glycosyltransferase family 1 protein [Dyadobacter psychrophilus]SKC18111.1 Glycosyltransferase involved in cell wall bisynthesis [Dyadobacter psychrophilus]
MSKVLIIGKLPPPIGGVTVHATRLIESLAVNGFPHFTFCDLKNDSFCRIIRKIAKHRIIHLHASNPLFQLLFAMVCVLSGKKLFLTYHGDWGRYGILDYLAVKLSASLCSVPIVQNKESLAKAKFYNGNALLISTFIPATYTTPLSQLLSRQLADFRQRFKFVFCTNAWNLSFDKNGKEIYGLSQIISNIRHVDCGGLIISDPSDSYKPFITKTFGQIPENVLFIGGQHDFGNVLQVSDAFIRNTTTDGISLSIYEAHERNVVVLASASVSRADFCNVYHDISKIDLVIELEKGRIRLQTEGKIMKEDVTSQLIELYNRYI